MINHLAMLLSAAAQTQPPEPPSLAPPLDPAAVEELVVTGTRPNRTASPAAVDLFRTYCFDPLRRAGRWGLRSGDPLPWQPLGAEALARLRLGSAGEAALLIDHVRGHRLVLAADRILGDDGLVSNRCTMVVIGGADHVALRDGMSGMFRGPGTNRHVGLPEGAQALPGWQQHVWTGMPARGNSNWRVRAGSSFLVVLEPSFFNRYDYILGDLKTRGQGPGALATLSVVHTSQPRR